MRIGHSGQDGVLVTATVVAVALAAVLTTVVTTYGPSAAPGTQLSGRPPVPLDVPVVRAPPADPAPASVLGGPPEPDAR